MNIYSIEGLAQALFAEAGDALFLLDPENEQLLGVNAMAERLTQLSQKELLQKPAMHWFRFPQEEDEKQSLRSVSARTGIFHSKEGYSLRTREESVWVPVNLTISRLHVKPKTLALITARDIREQRAAYSKVKRTEAEFRRVLQSVSDCLWSATVDEAGKWSYQYFSPVAQRITGYPSDYFMTGPARWQKMVHDEDRPRWQKFIQLLCKGLSGQEEYRLVLADGSHRWIRESVQVSKPGDGVRVRLDGVITDITARKALEEASRENARARERYAQELEATNQALSESERRYRQLTEATLDAIVVADRQGLVLLFNPAAEKLFDYTAAEMIGQPLVQLIAAPDQEIFKKGCENYLETGTSQLVGKTMELTGRRKDGSEFPMEQALSVLQGEKVRFLAAIRDLTERNRLRTVLVQNEKLASIGRLTAGLAHEINNPLTYVANNMTVLERDCQGLLKLLELYDAEASGLARIAPERAEQIQACAEEMDLPYVRANLGPLLQRTSDGLARVTRIIRSMRGYARMAPANQQEVYLPDLIASSLEIIQGTLRKRSIDVEQDFASPPKVSCVFSDINQVILNLLVNACHAIEAMPPTHAGKIRISIRSSQDEVVLDVADNGCGIAPENRLHLFDPFFTTKDVNQGSGLGLWICHNVLTAHGGRIELAGQPGPGTCFRVTLPRHVSA